MSLEDNLSRNLKTVMKERGLSTHTLAELASVSQKAVYSATSGMHSPSLRTLGAICAALSVDAGDLIKDYREWPRYRGGRKISC